MCRYIYTNKGYKFDNENHPKLIFLYCIYTINDSINAFTFLNHAEGGYSLDLVTYKNKKAIDITDSPICFIWNDMGYIKHTITKRVMQHKFMSESKESFQGNIKYSQNIIEIRNDGKIGEVMNQF